MQDDGLLISEINIGNPEDHSKSAMALSVYFTMCFSLYARALNSKREICKTRKSKNLEIEFERRLSIL